MKDTHFLYSIATLAIGSIFAIFVSYAAGTLPTMTPQETSPTIATTPAMKSCGCCVKTPQELKARLQRNEALRKQWRTYRKAAELIKQYGLTEGPRRIKEFAPEVAAQFENFPQKNAPNQEH